MRSSCFLVASLLLLCAMLDGRAWGQDAPPQPAAQAVTSRPAPVASGFRISGTVVNALTGDPLPRCRLAATLATTVQAGRSWAQAAESDTTATVQSDASGHFMLILPSAGAWRLTATARGFRTQAYEQHDGFSSAVVLRSAAPVVDLTFKLVPDAAIEGTVLDEAGDPIRNATVTLLTSPQPGPDLRQRPTQRRASTVTDDRGYYEFDDLAPGDYLIGLHARPWYASAGLTVGGAAAAANPLDVVYPPMWYPDVTDFSSATPLSLQAGDRREADFHPLPQPGIHVRISAPSGTLFGQGGISLPYVTELSPNGTETNVQTEMHRDGQGNWDLSGLAPGSYEVHPGGSPNGAGSASLLEVNATSPRVVDLSAASSLATVAITVEAPGNTAGLQVSLIDLTTGRSTTAPVSRSSRGSSHGRSSPFASGAEGEEASNSTQDRSAQLPPGSYEVVLNGANDLYLTGITASGAEATGRIVHLHAGSARLVLHVASGRAAISGVVSSHGLPVVAATVLLVPATLGAPSALTTLRRDQTNTDGSFDLSNVLPGAYILLAIDHGWTVNWRDPATLRRYLMGGIAINLAPAAVLKRDLEVQKP